MQSNKRTPVGQCVQQGSSIRLHLARAKSIENRNGGGPQTLDLAEETELTVKLQSKTFSADIEQKHLIKAIFRLDN